MVVQKEIQNLQQEEMVSVRFHIKLDLTISAQSPG